MPAHGGTPKLVADAGIALSPIWSPDGKMIAFIDYEVDQICIIPIGEDGEAAGQVMTIDQPETINVRRLVGWTPDKKIGAIFQSHVEYALYTLPVKGGMAALVTHGGFPSYPRWSPDGKRIFHTNVADEGSGAWQRKAIAFVPAEGGKVTTVPIQSDAKIESGGGNRVSPDGTMIVFSGMTQESSSMPSPFPSTHIWTLPVEGGKPKQLTKPPEESMTEDFPCWSPDGKAIAFVRAKKSDKYYRYTGEISICIVQLNGGEPKPLKSESDHIAFGPIAWSPDGRLLAYFSRYEANSPHGMLKVIPVDGGESRVVGKVQNIHLHKELAWSPDSKRIAFNGPRFVDKFIKVISLNDGSIVDIETDLVDTSIYHLDWSPDGESLVFAGYTEGGPEFWVMENFLPESTVGE
jgi:Tol biopolymer transport system component